MPSRYTQRADRTMAPPAHRAKSAYADGGYYLEDGRVRQEDIRLSFAIMAHPKRKEWVDDLVKQIPEATVVWDQKNDRHDTGIRSILAYDPKATHHAVIQDDVILGKDIVPGLAQALKYVDPLSPVGLYHGGKGRATSDHVVAAEVAAKNRAKWVVRKGPIWGPGIVYPVRTISILAEWYDKSEIQNYDRRVMRFYYDRGVMCWYSFPSLVDHRAEDNPSLCGHDGPNRGRRVARVFSGPQSALDVDWGGPVVRFRR
jgi:hypothetical protein